MAALDLQALCTSLRDIKDVSLLVTDLEDGKDVPVLLHYYLRLGATLLGVNVDTKFSNVIDGLLLVDLTKTDPKFLQRLMGHEGFAQFAAHHHPPLPEAIGAGTT
jgi:hypothetical protein